MHFIEEGIFKTYLEKDNILLFLFLRPTIKIFWIVIGAIIIFDTLAFTFNLIWLSYLPFILVFFSFFQSSFFLYFLLKKGLRKIGIKGKIKRVYTKDLIYKVVSNE